MNDEQKERHRAAVKKAWANNPQRRAQQASVLAQVTESNGGVAARIARLHKGSAARLLDPARYPPAGLSETERADYRVLIKKKYRMREALLVLGRGDLLTEDSPN